jgi:starch-binding outer membrane protein, SusD/RagB family
MKSTYKFFAFFILIPGLGMSCKKLVEVPGPITSLNSATVYSTDATAAAVLTGIYQAMSNNNFSQPGLTSMSFLPGLSSDELSLFPAIANTGFQLYYTNALSATVTTYRIDFWTGIYPVIFTANSAIEGLNSSTSLTPAVKQQLLGEAEFIRAFCYFYLVNLYGDVSLALSSDYTANAVLARTATAQVYQQIVTDLKDAQSKLSPTYLDATLLNTTTARVRPTSWAATALLARTYLYTGDYADAALQASSLISNSGLFGLSTLNNAFLLASLGNNEAIWQLQSVLVGYNTVDAETFILPATGPSNPSFPVSLNSLLVNAFEPGDQRRTHWIDSVIAGGTTYYYAYKYKSATLNAPSTEYNMVLRLGEQYLIRAEAEANGAGNGIGAAVSDLNTIRSRAGLPNYAGATDKASLLTAILHERQVELFTEWGHRWLDLKRTGNVDAVMSIVTPTKGGTWSSYQQLYPVPLSEIQADANLKQNTGY